MVTLLTTPAPALPRLANSYDLLKVVALLTMLVDHVGLYLLPEVAWLRLVGRVAFPLFLFLVGYSRHTQLDVRLLGMALLVSGLDWLHTGTLFPLNILWGIALTRWYLRGHTPQRAAGHFLPLLLLVPLTPTWVAYGTMPLLLGTWGRLVRDSQAPHRCAAYGALALAVHIWIQVAAFSWPLGYAVGLGLLAGLLVRGLGAFTLRSLPLPSVAVYLSRHALAVYVLHLAALQGLAWLLQR